MSLAPLSDPAVVLAETDWDALDHAYGTAKAVAPLLRAMLATSALRQYQERAMEALTAWGEDTAGLQVRRQAFEACDAPSHTSSSTE